MESSSERDDELSDSANITDQFGYENVQYIYSCLSASQRAEQPKRTYPSRQLNDNRDREGRVADFHATRHTFISGIVAGNASIKVAQELARHSTSRLTVDRYCHTTTHEVVDALDALPEPKTKKTDPNGSQSCAQRQAQRAKPRFCLRRGASSRTAQQKTRMIPSPRNHTR